MKYLGVFENELPNFREVEIDDFFSSEDDFSLVR